jgi:hypothetical protein
MTPIKVKFKPKTIGIVKSSSQPSSVASAASVGPKIHKAPQVVASPNVRFPAAWGWFFDEAVTAFVKSNYSPKESWKDKPFSKEDSRFFFKGIDELSELFTEERSRGIPAYFNHPKFRSAYLLYFFPLQAAKFVSLYQMHAKAFEAVLEHGKHEGEIRIADLGAGPGTASIAALLQLLQMATVSGDELPKIKLLWVDTNLSVMQDGKNLTLQLASHFSRLRGKVEIELKTGPWWKAPQFINKPTSLMLLGHVINESAGPDKPTKRREDAVPSQDDTETTGVLKDAGHIEEDMGDEFDLPMDEGNWGLNWKKLFSLAAGGGTLIVEPASKQNSQFLSQFRDEFLARGLIDQEASSIWGPCLHAERCPLATGRDWCHFSVPAHVPGNWFSEFSKSLGSERQWLKYSYLWFASQIQSEKKAPTQAANLRRVISDPLTPYEKGPRTQAPDILLCEPEVPGRITVPRMTELKRGDLIKLN